jgi:hypothetical protein
LNACEWAQIYKRDGSSSSSYASSYDVVQPPLSVMRFIRRVPASLKRSVGADHEVAHCT